MINDGLSVNLNFLTILDHFEHILCIFRYLNIQQTCPHPIEISVTQNSLGFLYLPNQNLLHLDYDIKDCEISRIYFDLDHLYTVLPLKLPTESNPRIGKCLKTSFALPV